MEYKRLSAKTHTQKWKILYKLKFHMVLQKSLQSNHTLNHCNPVHIQPNDDDDNDYDDKKKKKVCIM